MQEGERLALWKKPAGARRGLSGRRQRDARRPKVEGGKKQAGGRRTTHDADEQDARFNVE